MVRSSFILTKFASIVILGSMILFFDPQVSAQDKIQLLIDTAKPGPKIDRNIFGQFAEHLGYGVYEGIWVGSDSKIPNTRGIRNDVVAALKALKVPNVRWPGGCFADEYGETQPGVLARWAANAPLAFVDQNISSLRQYRGIALDVGDQDGLRVDTVKLHEVLDKYGIANSFEQYQGTHTSKVADRFQNHVLKFFSEHLCFETRCR